MKTRKISITIDEAIKWYKSENVPLKELALRVFNENELMRTFKDIKTFKDACEVLGLSYTRMDYTTEVIAIHSKSSAAMFKLNIIRKALNLGFDLSLTENPKGSTIYYPYNPFVTENSTYYKDELNSCKMEIIGKIKSEGKIYNILGGSANTIGYTGLCHFKSGIGVGSTDARNGFLGCATKEIAQHFGKYFGMLITKAKYADMTDFEITEDKYGNTK